MIAARPFAAALLIATSTAAAPIPGTIALIGVDHQVYLAAPDGSPPRPLTRGEEPGRMTTASALRRVSVQSEEAAPGGMRFSYPAWSPDGKALLVLGARMSGEAVAASGVYRLAPDRTGLITPLYEDPRRAPIYLFWDPTGRRAAALVSDAEAIALGVLDAAAGGLRVVHTGLPFYFAWRSDGTTLLAHVGGSARENRNAALLRIDVGREEPKIAKLDGEPAGFRAPSWSPDGKRFAWAGFAPGQSRSELFVQEPGEKPRSIGHVSSRAVFSWTPEGSALAIGDAAVPGGTLLAGMTLVQVADGGRRPLYAGPVGAWFISPDGTRWIVAAPDFDTGEWRWLVVERKTGEARELVRFLPNPEFQMLLLHFDQYALSHRLWAPDSRHFVFAAYPATGNISPGLAVPSVWMVDTREGKPTRIGDGRSAFWSPR